MADEGDLSRSASTIVASRGHHVVEIDVNSAAVAGAHSLRSGGSFQAGGHAWHVNCGFLQGTTGIESDDPRADDFISVYLLLDDDIVRGAVVAQATFNLLAVHGEPVPSFSATTLRNNFSVSTTRCGYERFIRRGDLQRSGQHLRDGRFVRIACQVAVVKEAPPSIPVVVPPSDMASHFMRLLESGDGADVEFRVGGLKHMAHRCVLAARSPVFMAKFFGPMKEGVATSVVRIDDMDPTAFIGLLKFIYTDIWPYRMEEEDEEEVVLAQHLLVAADKYCMDRLKHICEDRLCNHINIGSVAIILTLAEQHSCSRLKEACYKFLDSSTLYAVMKTDGFGHLSRSCPVLTEELTTRVFMRS